MKLTVDYINDRVSEDISGFVDECEHRYYGEIHSIAEHINDNPDKKIIMIAGPSGSGKTTTAHILCDYLRQLGKHTEVVSLDDFYLNRENSPRDEFGKPDYETVHSLDIDEINRCFSEVLKNGECMMPIYDFGTGKRKKERKNINIKNGGLMIVEGLHALNPLLSEQLTAENLFKIYISVNRAIYNSDGSVALSSRQMRLIRRMSRDSIYRNSSPQQTFEMWESVISGEQKYLYGFKPTADKQITTLHEYEPCIFVKNVLGLLGQINPSVEDYEYVEKTIKGLSQFVEAEESAVPHESLIREFIRGGKYE